MTTDNAQGSTTLRFEPDLCANCFEPLPGDEKHRPVLFCSDLCRDYASTVRYWRKAARTGTLAADPSVSEAISTRVAHLLAGGYDSRGRRVTAETRALVIDRDKICVNCGRPGEEIDHIDGGSNDPVNLQYLCTDCHHAKTQSHMVPASKEQVASIAALEKDRVMPDEPAQLCDDDIFWEHIHRQLSGERTARLRGQWDGVQPMPSDADRQEIAAFTPRRATFYDTYDPFDDDDFGARGEDDDSGFGEDSYYARAMGKDD